MIANKIDQWTRAALQDAMLLGKLESFPEFSEVDNFYSLFRRLLGMSVSSLKNRLKSVFLDTKTLDQRFWGFAVKVRPAATLVKFPCNMCDHVADSRSQLAGHLKHSHNAIDEVRWLVCKTICPCCNVEFGSRERIIRPLLCDGSLLCRFSFLKIVLRNIKT